MGGNDAGSGGLRGILWNIAGYHAGSAGFGQRSGDIKYDHVGNSGFLDGTDADRGGIRPGGTVDERCPAGHPAMGQIALNCIANMLGLGWAATPAGMKAMEELSKLEKIRREQGAGVPAGTASDEMCTFLVLNISSLQLVPVNIIAYRSQYGSVNPAAVTGPAIVATLVSTGAAVVFCKIMNSSGRYR